MRAWSGLRPRDGAPEQSRPDHAAQRRAVRRVHHIARPRPRGWPRDVPNTLLEIWRPMPAAATFTPWISIWRPLDPNFTSAGRAQTDTKGCYRFVTIKRGFPWGKLPQCEAAGAYSFPLFGHAFITRVVTQMFSRRSALPVRSDFQLGAPIGLVLRERLARDVHPNH